MAQNYTSCGRILALDVALAAGGFFLKNIAKSACRRILPLDVALAAEFFFFKIRGYTPCRQIFPLDVALTPSGNFEFLELFGVFLIFFLTSKQQSSNLPNNNLPILFAQINIIPIFQA
jgi:hypothetical protein